MLKAKIKRTIRVRHILKCLLVFFFERVKKWPTTKNTLLLVRLDAIGDYILFRNFLQLIRTSEKYHSHHITVVGNQLWKAIALEFDNHLVDEWIWVDKQQLVQNKSYRKNLITTIASKGFETAVLPNAARDFLHGDSLIRASGAKHKIGSKASKTIDPWFIGLLGNFCYNTLINNSAPLFEFDKNVLFFEQLLQQKITLNKPNFILPNQTKTQQVLILPGAGEKKRQWSSAHFAQLIQFIQAKYTNHIITLCGAGSDADKINEINHLLLTKVNCCIGCMPLHQLVFEMHTSSLVIAHDSGSLHMAMAVGAPSIGLMTGKHYKRFAPYTIQYEKHQFIFPVETEQLENLLNQHGPKYFEDVFLDINKIEPEVVFKLAQKLLT